MASFADRAVGIHERTSGEIGDGPWVPGQRMQIGYLFAATVDGEPYLAFEVAPGNVPISLAKSQLVAVRKRGSGLNIVVDVDVRAPEGDVVTLAIVGTRGRVKKIFAFMGFPI
jgi:hypothetical protein